MSGERTPEELLLALEAGIKRARAAAAAEPPPVVKPQGVTLEPGWYWVDVVGGDDVDEHTERVREVQKRAKVRTSSSHMDEDPLRTWCLFKVDAPLLWTHSEGLGIPAVARNGARTVEANTEEAGEPIPTGIEAAENALESVGSGLKTLAWVAGLGFAAWGLSSLMRRR